MGRLINLNKPTTGFTKQQAASELKSKVIFQGAKKARRIDVDDFLKDCDNVDIGDNIALDFFRNVRYTGEIVSKRKDINGTSIIRCKILDHEGSYCIINASNGNVSITATFPDKKEIYNTKYDPATGESYITELDLAKADVIKNDPIHVIAPDKNTALGEPSFFLDPTPDDPATICLLVVYTPAAQSWANSNEGGINNTIADAVEHCNTASINSNLGINFVLAHSALVDYVEVDAVEDLTNLTNGSVPTVHDLRDTYHCDMVVMMTLENSVGGLGWLLTNRSGNADYAFSITRVQQASYTYTTIHEIGHNMGAHHHKAQNFQSGPTEWTDWANTSTAGWRWQGNDNKYYCDLMTYEDGGYFVDGIDHLRIPYFSSPLISYQGVVTGDADDGDNARALRETKHVVAAYRDGACEEEENPDTDPENCVDAELLIGDLCWKKCNLDVATYLNGDPITELTSLADFQAAEAAQEGAWCYYNFSNVNRPYGRLYNQYALLDARGIAETGWRVATDADWKNLCIELGMSVTDADVIGTPTGTGADLANALREQGTTYWSDSNGTNISGFSALGAGWYGRFTGGATPDFHQLRDHATWWTSSHDGLGGGWHRHLEVGFDGIDRDLHPQSWLFSVRLCKDCSEEVEPPRPPCDQIWEARYVAPKEYFTLSNWWTNNRHLHGNIMNPIYTFWGSEPASDNDETVLQIHIYPNNLVDPNRPHSKYYVEPEDPPDGFLEYYYAPDYQTDNDEIYIPYEFEELLILGFMTRLLTKLQDNTLIVRYNTALAQERLKTIEFMQAKQQTRARSLDSFVDPVIPMVSPQPLQNEAPVDKVD